MGTTIPTFIELEDQQGSQDNLNEIMSEEASVMSQSSGIPVSEVDATGWKGLCESS